MENKFKNKTSDHSNDILDHFEASKSIINDILNDDNGYIPDGLNIFSFKNSKVSYEVFKSGHKRYKRVLSREDLGDFEVKDLTKEEIKEEIISMIEEFF